MLFSRRAAAKKPAPSVPLREGAPPYAPLLTCSVQGIGARSEQQDAFAISSLEQYARQGFLAILCDGMGGMAYGRDIAQMAAKGLLQQLPALAERLPHSMYEAAEAVNKTVYNAYRGVGGTTLVLAYIQQNRLWFLTAGDSDLMLFRDGRLYAVNRRQEYRYELYRRVLRGEGSMGAIYANPQAGSITQFLGSASLQCDGAHRPLKLCKKDKLLLCSDGVSDTLSFAELESAMGLPLPEAVKALEGQIHAANRPDQDNYTAILIQYLGAPEHIS